MTTTLATRLPLARLAATIFILLAAQAGPARAEGNLLAGRRPTNSVGISNPRALTDGEAAFEGDEWNSTVAATFRSERAFAEYDLGRSVPINAAYLEGDNNDEYVISVSEDGAISRFSGQRPPAPSPGCATAGPTA